MSSKGQPSKQRRQSQNQKQRAALAARREAAARDAQASTTRAAGSGGGRGSVLSRLRTATAPGRGTTTGGTSGTPIGQRAALSAVFAALAAAVVGSFLFQVPVDRGDEPLLTRGATVAEWARSALDEARETPDATPEEIADSVDDWLPGGSQPYGKAFWPISASVVLPVIGTGLGLRAVSRRSSAKLVNRTMYVTLFGALLASQLMLIFLPAVISLAVAAFQVRKAEVAAARLAADEAGDPDDDVIDVDEVDDDEPLGSDAGGVIEVGEAADDDGDDDDRDEDEQPRP